MSIVTRTGDRGTTGLMYQRRVSKTHPRIEACGAVDELNAALGLARAAARPDSVRKELLAIQKDLVALMGELATMPEDLPRYLKDGHPLIKAKARLKLDRLARKLEAQKVTLRGWAVPGANLSAAALDMARAVCRRAERHVCALRESGQFQNPEALIFLNRLSDVLWLWARAAEGNGPNTHL